MKTQKSSPSLLVLAAGMASRYGSLKQLESFGPNRETIIDYSVYDAIRAGFGKVIFVVRKSIEKEFNEALLAKFSNRISVATVSQELDYLPAGFTPPEDRIKPWGTGHAVWVAASRIHEPFAVINADDFYGFRSFQIMAEFLTHSAGKDQYALMGYQLDKTLSKNGPVSRGICALTTDDTLDSIVEYTKIAETDRGIVGTTPGGQSAVFRGDEVVSMNMMGFNPSIFQSLEEGLKDFLKRERDRPGSEYYLPVVVNKLIRDGSAQVKLLRSPEKWFGVTYPDDKPMARESLTGLIEAGLYPEDLWKRNG